jgi:hypothetical protein
MNYDSTHVLFPFPSSLAPKSSHVLSGIGSGVPTLKARAQVAASADCPTCNLVEIPFNPNLPFLRTT